MIEGPEADQSPLTDRSHAPKQGHEGAPDAWIRFEPAVADAVKPVLDPQLER